MSILDFGEPPSVVRSQARARTPRWVLTQRYIAHLTLSSLSNVYRTIQVIFCFSSFLARNKLVWPWSAPRDAKPCRKGAVTFEVQRVSLHYGYNMRTTTSRNIERREWAYTADKKKIHCGCTSTNNETFEHSRFRCLVILAHARDKRTHHKGKDDQLANISRDISCAKSGPLSDHI